ncbi:8634_t:CDS:2, partial [Cetraspora pellucida]
MNKCFTCNNCYLPESFVYKGKTYKTCANCLISKAKKRKKLKNNDTEANLETISPQVLLNYIAQLISNIQNDGEILFEICIDLTDAIFSMKIFDNLKSIVRIIINKVEDDDDYIWSTSSASHVSARFNNHRTNYPFLIWNGSESKNVLIPDLNLQLQSSTTFAVDSNAERVDLDLYQQYETKVAALEYLAKHLREELSTNNLQHVRN